MSRIGNFDGIDKNVEKPEKNKKEAEKVPCVTEKDKEKLRDKSEKNKNVSDMTDREKADYYRSKGLKSLEDNRQAIHNNREGKGLTHKSAKLSSKNFDKLMEQRKADGKVTPEGAKDAKESFTKWNPEQKNQPKDGSDEVTVRHARPGEKVNVIHGKENFSSGNYVTKDKQEGLSPKDRIEKYALPKGNTAENYSPSYLGKKQNVIEGKVGSQKKFEGDDDIKRTGGGRQIITEGGYRNGAVKPLKKESGE